MSKRNYKHISNTFELLGFKHVEPSKCKNFGFLNFICILVDDDPYKYQSIWNDDFFCYFGNIKTLDQTLIELEQLRI